MEEQAQPTIKRNFIEEIIDSDLATNKRQSVYTRFPPEPNGYLHIGHAKSICLNFGLAEQYDGQCNLRFDDTNPVKEEDEYVRSITEDVRWLGFEWSGDTRFASDYFQQMFDWAVQLVQSGHAYVDDQSPDEIRANRGSLTTPGTNSPFRDRSPVENLELFEAMRSGKFKDGERVLRAKIDMASPNLNLRDPIMYRILHAHHHRSGDQWCIYPMYDWAHGLEDSIEGITHSICTLEFENHRPLYDWFLDKLEVHHPQQIEFARLNLNYTVMSKRKLLELVRENLVTGWDDPRMPTLSGLRRRGYTPESIRAFCADLGVSKFDGVVDVARLEHAIRQDLNRRAQRVMGVLNPLRVIIDNYPEDQVEELPAINNPEDESAGTRLVPFSRELFIEQDDFMEEAPRKFFRLKPGGEVRLRYAYWITCQEVIKDDKGNIVELRCTYDPETRGGNSPPDGRKVKGTLHWVSARHAVDAEVRLYDRLFTAENPNKTNDGQDWKSHLNPESLKILKNCKLEPFMTSADSQLNYQLERTGYFCVDPDSTADNLVLNRTVTLKDAWARMQKKN